MNRYKMLNCAVPKNIHTHPKGGIVGGMGGGAQKPKLDFLRDLWGRCLNVFWDNAFIVKDDFQYTLRSLRTLNVYKH